MPSVGVAPSVAVVIPHWNKRELLGTLLKRLREQTHPTNDVVVVDNGSADGSAHYAAELGARVLRFESNVGFARAVNAGIAQVHSDYVAVLNNDVVPSREWLQKLVEVLETAGTETWFACGKLQAQDGVVLDGTFDLVSRACCAWRAGEGRPDAPVWNQQRRIRSAPFTAALFRRDLFDRVGLLEEGFESYLEDVEFGLRCAVKGYSGVYVPAAVATHLGSATLGRWHPATVRQISRNQLLLAALYHSNFRLRRSLWPLLVGQGLWGLLALRHGTGAAWLSGKWEGLRAFRNWRQKFHIETWDSEYVFGKDEAAIRDLQEQTGYDTYWRFYFALTR
jgi:GT2 family glycosyltransferase